MLTRKSSFFVATFRFLVQSKSLKCVTVAKISPYPTLVSPTVECVAAWDVGFDHGCEDKAIKLILVATKQFLRELVVAIATDQKRYRIRENKVIYSIGQLTLNP
ncbi:putative Transcriptional adapter 1 [Daphnia magna]|uniref:Putative Transcriptional adapter 1 n=1 Tax=Daphnia magna TaxID=35525 RepID=A0A164LCE5_9CRUS|nr:putative Transcriptional adapter 1 [Daphnia magna]